MPIQWHPMLARFLRHDYGGCLDITPEYPLGEMPLRADFLLVRRDADAELPFPLNLLGQTTLLEFKGPDDTASQLDLQLLGIYADLYVYQEKLASREDLTLWFVASRFAQRLSDPRLACLEDVTSVGPGVNRAKLDRFVTYTVDLSRIPMTEELLCLLMVTNARERELAEFVVDRRERESYYLTFMHLMHQERLQEVLTVRRMTAEELELDAQTLIDACGEERLIDLLGQERVIDLLGGQERVIDLMGGREQVLRGLLRGLSNDLGAERVRELVQEGLPATAG